MSTFCCMLQGNWFHPYRRVLPLLRIHNIRQDQILCEGKLVWRQRTGYLWWGTWHLLLSEWKQWKPLFPVIRRVSQRLALLEEHHSCTKAHWISRVKHRSKVITDVLDNVNSDNQRAVTRLLTRAERLEFDLDKPWLASPLCNIHACIYIYIYIYSKTIN